MELPRIQHKRTLAVTLLLSLLTWLAGFAYLQHERNLQEELQLQGAAHAQQVAWQAVSTAHKVAMQSYFDGLMDRPVVLECMAAAAGDDLQRQVAARARLYRELFPLYEQLMQRNVRQLHFHTPDSRSFLRFHAPRNSGDSLVASRPSVVTANRTLKPVFGFETGRVIIGFRNVFPIVHKGKHLGSVELSQPFEAIRRGLYELEPQNEYLLLLKGSVLLPKLLEEHQKWYAPSQISPDWLVEDPLRELPDSSAPLSWATRQLYAQLRAAKDFQQLLVQEMPGAVALQHEGRLTQVGVIPLQDTDGTISAALISFEPAPQLAELYRGYHLNLLFFTVLVLFGGTALFLFLYNLQTRLEQEQQLGLITANIADGVYVMDSRGVISFANRRAAELLGYRGDELLGAVAHDLFHYHGIPGAVPLEQCPIYQVIQTRGRYEGEEQFVDKQGQLLTVQVASQAMLAGERVVGSVSVFRDVSEQKQLEEQLRLSSITDPLTGAYNRRFLQESLLKELYRAERHGSQFSVVMLDIDHFKQVNDRYGHGVGDQVLQYLVRLVQGRIRTSDLLARWGGEEFMLLLPATPVTAAVALAEELRAALQDGQIEGVGTVTASFGVTGWLPGDTVDLMQQRVDRLLYQAKESGRNCVKAD
ncbi:MAG: diguanylate cyclase [Geobacter sp.]|nr:diguanylate cyclase [Geobacter sp.]